MSRWGIESQQCAQGHGSGVGWRPTWDGNTWALHTAADDLESFFWVLIWSLVNILKKVVPISDETSTILRLEKALSSHSFDSILRRESIGYKESVFMNIVDEWQKINQDARHTIKSIEKKLRGCHSDPEVQVVFNELDKECLAFYSRFLRKGYSQLRIIQTEFTRWEDVIDRNDYDSLYT